MNKHELSNQRLAFTTGVIIVIGLFLIKLYPIAATVNLASSGTIPKIVYLSVFMALVALGTTSLALASLHIACRGVLLSLENGTNSEQPPLAAKLEAVCEWSYKGCITAILYLPFFLAIPAIPFLSYEAAKALGGGVAADLIGKVIQAIVSFLPPVAIISFLGYAYAKVRLFDLMRPNWIVVILLIVCWSILRLGMYTFDLDTNKNVIYQSKNDFLEVDLKLGGFASRRPKVDVELVNCDKLPIFTPEFTVLNDGKQIMHIQAQSLDPGRYDLTVKVGSYLLLALTELKKETTFFVFP